MIFTSLLLLLCQSEPSIIGPVTFTPAQPQESTQNPDLVLDTATWADYRMAMHLIDVRGRYDEGTAKLLQLVDQPDVIVFPGQASWMLAQAARALTLAGKNEEAAKYIPGARNGSRGTDFEQRISKLLASFAPQSAGLDPEFLEHLRSSLRYPPSQSNLVKDYGRQLLPYLKFIFRNEQGNISLQTRQRVLTMIFQVMDGESSKWIREELALQTPLAQQGLMNYLNNFMLGFLDVEARRESSEVLIDFAKNAPSEMKTLSLDLLLRQVDWYEKTSKFPADLELAQQLSSAIITLVEQGTRSSASTHLKWVEHYGKREGSAFYPIVLALGDSSNNKLREDVRWMIASIGSRDLLRKYALNGTVEDQIRFCLQPSLFVDYFLKGGANDECLEHGKWGLAQLRLIATQKQLDRLPSRSHYGDTDSDVFIQFESSPNPLVRYLAATALIAIGRDLQAASFLNELGDDLTWAKFFLARWRLNGRISSESMDTLLPLAAESPLKDEVRRLLESKGHDVLTVTMCRDWSLIPDTNAARRLWTRVQEEKSRKDVLWIMHSGSAAGLNVEGAYSMVAKNWPRDFIANRASWRAFNKSNSRSSRLESTAWESLISLEGNSVLREFETELDDFLFGVGVEDRRPSDANGIVEADPDLVIRLARNHVDDPKAMQWLSELSRLYSAIALRKIRDSDALSQFAADLMQSANYTFFDGSRPWLRSMVRQGAPNSEAYFIELWSKVDLTNSLVDFRITETVRNPSLRQRFRANLIEEMRDSQWTNSVISAYMDAGAIGEILEEILALVETNDNATTLTFLLQAIGSVDDLRVVEVLFAHLDDPREKVSNAASAALSRIQGIRAQKERWESWASGEEGTQQSPVEALLKNLRDPDLEIRLVSIESLGTLGEKDALPALINLLRDEDPQIKTAARKALDRINKVPTSTQSQVKAQLTVHLVELEGELAALRLKFTDSHMDVAAVLKKIEVAKEQLAELKSD